MPLRVPGKPWSRRAFVALTANVCGFAQPKEVRGETLPNEANRYLDSATEFPVVRLTNPEFTSLLTDPQNRCLSSRNFVLVSNDRFGKFDVFRLELRSGQWRLLTDAAQLDPTSVALLPGDRGFCYIDGKSVRLVDLAGRLRDREIYSAAEPFDRLGCLAVAPAGSTVYVVESKPGLSRVRAVPLAQGPAVDLAEGDTIGGLFPRPGGGLAYRSRDGIRFVDSQKQERVMTMAPGVTGPVFWSPDGSSLLYLNFPGKAGELNMVREHVLTTGEDRLIAKTTQYVQFAPNRDASVFVGASGSKASPHVLILLRATRRELTLCEHRARDPRTLAVVFAPNSQRILFQSDQQGKPAIYSMMVERFVEETES
jgi:oligogalacturonide lyase